MFDLIRRGCVVLCATGFLSMPAVVQAKTFNHVWVWGSNPGFQQNELNYNGVTAEENRAAQMNYQMSGGLGQPAITRSVYYDAMAEASIADGLKTKASTQLYSMGTTPPVSYTSTMLNAYASVGDSFTATGAGGGAYAWDADDEVTLTLDITGSMAGNLQSRSGNASATFINVFVFEAGYLDGKSDGLHGAYQWDALFFQQWHIGDYLLDPLSDQPQNTLDLDEDGYASLPITFKPGQDFDVVVILTSYVFINYSLDTGYAEQDFSSTVLLSIEGPQGATLTSESGEFLINQTGGSDPVTSAVPEPASAGLVAMGAVAMMLVGRRRRAA
jgi:hypothetical protein